MSYISVSLNNIINAVKKATSALSRDFGEIEKLQSSVRGHKEFTNAALENLKKALRAELQKIRPDYAVVFEGDEEVSTPHFLVSPFDGMLNFMHGIPSFAVSIATIEKNIITSAVIYNPATTELYFAEKGQGAFKEGFRNHERLRVSARKELADSLIGSEDSALQTQVAGIRVSGCIALDLAMVASGKEDALVVQDKTAASIAAGILLVKEAGGLVYELNQKDILTADISSVLLSGNVIAGNQQVAPKLHKLLNK